MTKQEILDAIEEFITANGLQEITGQILNMILTSIATIIPDDTMLTSSFGGTVKPGEPIVVTAGQPKWFFGEPGTYSNAGGLVLPSGSLNILSYDGASWKKNSIELPKNDDVSKVLSSFLSVTKRVETLVTMPYTGEHDGAFKNGSFGDVAASYGAWGQIPIADLQGVDLLRIEGDMTSMGAGAMYLGMRTAAGTNVSIKSGNSSAPFEIAVDHTAQYYVYSRYKDGANPTKFKKVSIVPDIKLNAVADAITPLSLVLKSFIKPTKIEWEEIIMPWSTETDGKFRYCGGTYADEPNWATGEILASNLAGYKYLKMTGDFRVGGPNMLYLYRYNATTYFQEVCGNKDYSEYLMDIEATGRIGIGYSRKKGVHKFYKGKVVELPITEDSVNLAIQNASASAKHRMIDAFVEFNVKASNTAAQNTEGLNQAILAAYSRRVPIYLPSGVIKITGIQESPGVSILGAGLENTTLQMESGSVMFSLLDTTNTQAFWECNYFANMTIDGNNVADYGLKFRNMFGFYIENVKFRRFKNLGVDYEGVLSPRFYRCKFQEGVNGIKINATDTSSAGYMQANICEFNSTWFAELTGKSVDIQRASNIVFRSCDFERVGTAGNTNTGGVFATNLSPGNEGIDITFENCWSETLKGSFLNISNSKGVTVIRDTMVGNEGNTAATNVVNNGCKVLLTGSTQLRGSTTGILTQNNGETRVDGFVRVNTHVEQTGGSYKQVTYS